MTTRKFIGIDVPKYPSKRQDDYYVIRLQFSRKLVGLLVAIFIILSRLFEALGVETIRHYL